MPVGHARHDIGLPEAAGAHDLQRHGQQLGVGRDIGLADDVDVQLEVLAQSSLLLSLVPEELRYRVPANRLAQRVRARGDHARERRRHLGTQCDLATTLVDEVVELPDDLFAALFRVEIERFQRRTVVLLEAEPACNIMPRAKNVFAFGQFLRVEIAESG